LCSCDFLAGSGGFDNRKLAHHCQPALRALDHRANQPGRWIANENGVKPMSMEQTAIIIVAAGRGLRASSDMPKQWRDLGGRSVLARSVAACLPFGRVILVLHPDDMARGLDVAPGQVTLVAGGATRHESVGLGLACLEGSGIRHVLIHDGARPFVSAALIARVLSALETHVAAAPAIAVTDALWQGRDGMVIDTHPRDGLYRAQTPQGFRFPEILAAHRRHPGNASDDAEVARLAGLGVAIVAGEEENFKITWPEDFLRAERQLGAQMDVRLGNGYDVHAFCAGDHVMLCGVKVPHDQGLLGHSDADVGMHALTDAIYGALAAGDIGRHFPPSDPQWKGAASSVFLAHAGQLARKRGYRLSNADVTLVCEDPKIGPHAQAMADALAAVLEVEPGRISVKATTSERLGFTGRREGIAALATAALVKS
jgi:2-C-methyl-D-erythritol 4-phosphate cytidylyltransferase / 2-C-methyl-D-erythritol 2,4-cyclodiphosphate synthase